jgi:hypothetical protein
MANRKIYTESGEVLMFIALAWEVSDLEYHISAILTWEQERTHKMVMFLSMIHSHIFVYECFSNLLLSLQYMCNLDILLAQAFPSIL